MGNDENIPTYTPEDIQRTMDDPPVLDREKSEQFMETLCRWYGDEK